MTAIRMPHDGEPKRWIATAWPRHPDWGTAKARARAEIAAMARAAAGAGETAIVPSPPADGLMLDASLLASAHIIGAAPEPPAPAETPDTPELDHAPPPEVLVLAAKSDLAKARKELGGDVQVLEQRAVDIWLRDVGPVYVLGADGVRAVRFSFNGWGGRFPKHADPKTARLLIDRADALTIDVDLIAEGGSLDSDGQGTLIATRSSLLGANRNPSRSARDVERVLGRAVGAERVIWLEEGLVNDHTDGHVDTLARFVRPGLVACQAPAGPHDPNAAVLDAVARTLDSARDADGRRLDVARIPSPGLVAGADGAPRPASHMNYIYAGDAVIVPVYDTPTTANALTALAEAIPDRRILSAPAQALVEQGGAFHCATNAAPAEGARL